MVATYVRVEEVDIGTIFRRRWRWSLGLGLALAAFLVFNVLNTEDATARPDGIYFAFEIFWRGAGYGLVDTLLLTAFPCFVAHKLLHGRVDGVKGKVRFTALTLPLVLVITATYHWATRSTARMGSAGPKPETSSSRSRRSRPPTRRARSLHTSRSTSRR